MIWVPISRNSRGSMALTLPWVPTDMKTGVSTTPWAVVNRPRRALVSRSFLSNSKDIWRRRGKPPAAITQQQNEGRGQRSEVRGQRDDVWVCMAQIHEALCGYDAFETAS